jgi:hypothetical protein
VRSSRFRGDDDLAVIISLVIAVGMLIGVVAAMWLWGAMSESVEAVMSLQANETPETIEELRQAK